MFKSEVSEEMLDKINEISEAKSMLTVLAEKIKENGRVEGKIEGKTEVAIKMKNEKMPLDLIAKITGLSVEQLNKL